MGPQSWNVRAIDTASSRQVRVFVYQSSNNKREHGMLWLVYCFAGFSYLRFRATSQLAPTQFYSCILSMLDQSPHLISLLYHHTIPTVSPRLLPWHSTKGSIHIKELSLRVLRMVLLLFGLGNIKIGTKVKEDGHLRRSEG
jgi:hypothetical protein